MSRENAILADMQKQIWAMEPRYLNALFTSLVELEIKMPANAEAAVQPKMSIIGDTAVIRISGVLLKTIPQLYKWLSIEMTSYIDIQSQLAEAVANPAVKKILLDVDSPGGTVAGVMETGLAIAEAAAQKKVTAKVDDLGASGAYWLASQASSITAGPNAEVGSIGVFTVYVDYSKYADEKGFTVHVIRSGEHKGMGVPGAEISEEQIQAVQDIIDGMAENFIKAVSSGRKMKAEDVRKLADGRTFLAAEAVKNGLIDNVINAKKAKAKEKKIMAETQEEQTAGKAGQTETTAGAGQTAADAGAGQQAGAEKKATIAELKAAFPNEAQFVLDQFEKGATVNAAKAAYADVLMDRNKQLQSENAELSKKIKKQSSGASPVPAGGEGKAGGEDFMSVVKDYATEHKCSRTDALKAVRKSRPELHEAYIEHCRNHKVRDRNEE